MLFWNVSLIEVIFLENGGNIRIGQIKREG